MEAEEVLHHVQRAGLNARIRKDEVILETCLFCGNSRWNLELNGVKGVFGCWACREGGALQNFFRRFLLTDVQIDVNISASEKSTNNPLMRTGRKMQPVETVKSASHYLMGRGLTYRDLHTYSIQVATDPGDPVYGRILIPVNEYWTGAIIGFVARSYFGHQGPKYLNLLDEREIVGFREGGQPNVHVLVEGVFDAIKVNKAGFQCGALLGVQVGSLVTEWAALAPPSDHIVVLVDGDAQRMGQKIYSTLDVFRDNVHLVILPGQTDPGMLDAPILAQLINKHLGE